MLQPPVSDLAPWRPGYWITQTGYALNDADVVVSTRGYPRKRTAMLRTSEQVQKISERVMSE